jgi:hypothetical protein
MGRLIHCLGMFLRDMSNKRARVKERYQSNDFDPHKETDRIALVALKYSIIVSIIIFLVSEFL